jgi:hypothetical protein
MAMRELSGSPIIKVAAAPRSVRRNRGAHHDAQRLRQRVVELRALDFQFVADIVLRFITESALLHRIDQRHRRLEARGERRGARFRMGAENFAVASSTLVDFRRRRQDDASPPFASVAMPATYRCHRRSPAPDPSRESPAVAMVGAHHLTGARHARPPFWDF